MWNLVGLSIQHVKYFNVKNEVVRLILQAV